MQCLLTGTHHINTVPLLIKLKLIARHDPAVPWDFPLVIYNDEVITGTGRVIVDKYLFHRENGPAIVISNFDAPMTKLSNQPYTKLNSIADLQCNIPFHFSVTVQDGKIVQFERRYLEFNRTIEKLAKINIQKIKSEIEGYGELTLASLIRFMTKENLES